MKYAIKILGGLLVVIGVVWILQGFNILPGSFMTGDKFWAGMGAIAAAVGVLLLFLRIGRPKA
ncbi:MAG TPA: hypothetical protein VG735_13720 [Caulobacterales bacterium]|nr:hypothetical protein [Caulobacterales bacterium]